MIRFGKIITLATLALIIAGTAIAQAGTVRVSSEVFVALDRVTLADLVSQGDNEWTEKSAGVFLCQAPNPGQSRVLKGHFVRNKFEQAGLDNVEVPENIRIVRKSNVVSAMQIKTAVEQSLRDVHGNSFRIEFMGGLSDVVIPSGKSEISVEGIEKKKLSGRMIVPVSLRVDSKQVAQKHVDVKILKTVSVWSVRYHVPKGVVVSKDHLSAQTLDLSKTRGRPFTSLDEILGKRATRALSKGTVLIHGLVEQAPVVKKGDIVTIVAQSGPLVVKTFGIVQKEAVRGGVVTVRNLTSGLNVYAQVINASTVQVTF